MESNKLRKQFLQKIQHLSLRLERPSSFTNPTFLKEQLSFDELVQEINARFDLSLHKDHFDAEQEFKKFGEFSFQITDYTHPQFPESKESFGIQLHLANTELSLD